MFQCLDRHNNLREQICSGRLLGDRCGGAGAYSAHSDSPMPFASQGALQVSASARRATVGSRTPNSTSRPVAVASLARGANESRFKPAWRRARLRREASPRNSGFLRPDTIGTRFLPRTTVRKNKNNFSNVNRQLSPLLAPWLHATNPVGLVNRVPRNPKGPRREPGAHRPRQTASVESDGPTQTGAVYVLSSC